MTAQETAILLAGNLDLASRLEKLYNQDALMDADQKVFDLYCSFNYPFRTWCPKFPGFIPVALLDSADYSEAYEQDCMSLFELTGGRSATVLEQGCSCYDYDWAQIELHADVEAGQDAFNAYKRSNETGR